MRYDARVDRERAAMVRITAPDAPDQVVDLVVAADTEEGWLEVLLEMPPVVVPEVEEDAAPRRKPRKRVMITDDGPRTIMVYRDFDVVSTVTGEVLHRVRRRPGEVISSRS